MSQAGSLPEGDLPPEPGDSALIAGLREDRGRLSREIGVLKSAGQDASGLIAEAQRVAARRNHPSMKASSPAIGVPCFAQCRSKVFKSSPGAM